MTVKLLFYSSVKRNKVLLSRWYFNIIQNFLPLKNIGLSISLAFPSYHNYNDFPDSQTTHYMPKN